MGPLQDFQLRIALTAKKREVHNTESIEVTDRHQIITCK